MGLPSQPTTQSLFLPVDPLMLELLIIFLVVGFVIYFLLRRPIKFIKYTFAFLGLILLGVIGVMGFGMGVAYIAQL